MFSENMYKKISCPLQKNLKSGQTFLLFVVFKIHLLHLPTLSLIQVRSQFGCGYIFCHNNSAAIYQIILKTALQVVCPEYFRIGTICFHIAVVLQKSVLLYRCVKNRNITVERNRNHLYLAMFICQMRQCGIFFLWTPHRNLPRSSTTYNLTGIVQVEQLH